MANLTYDDELYCRYLLGDVTGVPPGEFGVTWQQDLLTGSGYTYIYNLTFTPSTDFPIVVTFNGVIQLNPEVWSLGTATLIFVTPPANGVIIVATYTH